MTAPRVLVVDDSKTLRVHVQGILTRAGYEVHSAASGTEGIACVQSFCPHLMILDIQMPDKDGYSVCEELQRLGPPWNQLPIVFLTTLQSRALDLLGDQMGGYLHKPVSEEELLNTVAQFVERPAYTVFSPEPLADVDQVRAYI